MHRVTRRLERKESFEIFASRASEDFNSIAARDKDHKILCDVYKFYVVHGGRDGGLDKRQVEIFYGTRPFETVEEYSIEDNSIKLKTKVIADTGATLLYRRTDSGIILCTLHPAHSENYRRKETGIVLGYIRSPDVLLMRNSPVIRRHWKSFISYMKYTSLDGEPSMSDNIRVWCLLISKERIISKRVSQRILTEYAGKLLFYTLTIGLSGFLLVFIQWIFPKY